VKSPASGAAPTGLNDVESDDLLVRALFEIGRLDLSLRELRLLDVGALLPLALGADYAVDIVVSDKRIGRGELVNIGGKVGVRVTWLFDYA
jgi:type III secretion protein Q